MGGGVKTYQFLCMPVTHLQANIYIVPLCVSYYHQPVIYGRVFILFIYFINIINQCDDCSKAQDELFESGDGSQIICDHVTVNQLFPDSILEEDRLWELQNQRQTMDSIEKLPSQDDT